MNKRSNPRSAPALAVCASLLMAATTYAAATPAQKCEAGKNGTAGKYAACLHKAQQKFVSGGETDTAGRDAAILSCGTKYADRFQSYEDRAGLGVCPSEGDVTSIQDFLDACIFNVEDALAGGTLRSVGLQETGQTICYNSAGTVIACTGTGQDGELQKGAANSFTDNGDGTVTDNSSGLMWEKLSDDGTIHDKDTTYTWANAFAGKVVTLNSSVFAGYGDWRMPNVKELQTLQNFGAVNPATFSEFNSACAAACTVLTCSCTRSNYHWSSSTDQDSPFLAWSVHFVGALTSSANKTIPYSVRAVRAGS